jgi:hypothetical protein
MPRTISVYSTVGDDRRRKWITKINKEGNGSYAAKLKAAHRLLRHIVPLTDKHEGYDGEAVSIASGDIENDDEEFDSRADIEASKNKGTQPAAARSLSSSVAATISSSVAASPTKDTTVESGHMAAGRTSDRETYSKGFRRPDNFDLAQHHLYISEDGGKVLGEVRTSNLQQRTVVSSMGSLQLRDVLTLIIPSDRAAEEELAALGRAIVEMLERQELSKERDVLHDGCKALREEWSALVEDHKADVSALKALVTRAQALGDTRWNELEALHCGC